MYEVINGCCPSGEPPLIFPEVFLHGEEGIPLQGNRVINRFTNFADDQLLIWLMHHTPRGLTRIPGPTLPLYGDWSGNFWHWCYEALPVALAAQEAGFRGTYLVPQAAFAADSLVLMGVSPEQIVRAEETDYFLECMCLQEKLRGSDRSLLPALERIRTTLRSRFAREGRRERIYISRNGNPEAQRKVVNEDELQELLSRFGFTTLRMEELTLEQQLSHTCNAEALIGPHGAGMTHCSFLPPGALVLELFAPSFINPCMLSACRQLGHRYHQVTSPCYHNGYQHGQDVVAYLDIIELTLERELGRP